jgi:hypothetical protein
MLFRSDYISDASLRDFVLDPVFSRTRKPIIILRFKTQVLLPLLALFIPTRFDMACIGPIALHFRNIRQDSAQTTFES